jgi:para-nitrobenzyl esterase
MEKSRSTTPGVQRLALMAAILPLFFLAACAGTPDLSARDMPLQGNWTGSSLVATKYGAVRGGGDSFSTIAWKGLPYAAPPTGDLRWKAPRPLTPWQGIREASAFGPQAVQRVPVLGWAAGNEDCLYLNVWRPADGRARLPVYFWIHGGGNSTGSANSSDAQGQAFAAHAGAVFVSVEYRLGPFGWFVRPEVTGNAEDDSGNYGTLDLIAALGWVRDNIASFGGDPGNVTIAGESAGAFNVLTLLLAPAARGLFHRAVVESAYRTDSTPEKMSDFASKIIAKIPGSAKEASASRILSLAPSGLIGMLDMPYPNWDGKVLPAEGFAAFSDPAKVADVPIIIGTNKEETKLFQWLSGKNSRDPGYQKGAEIMSASWKAEGADSIADAIVSGDPGRKVYVYRFDWGALDAAGRSVQGGRAGAKLGAAHAMEVSFFLGNDSIYNNVFLPPVFTNENEPGRKALQTVIGSYLAAFIANGNPNAGVGSAGEPYADLPAWEPWSADSPEPSFMVLDAGLAEAKVRLERGRITRDSAQASIDASSEPMRASFEVMMQ